MSFEGYYQLLCENGHHFAADCYSHYGSDFSDTICPDCGAPVAWWNLVNQTNCCSCYGVEEDKYDPSMCEMELSFDEIQKTCQFNGAGYIEPEIDRSAITSICNECGNVKTIAQTRYKIPEHTGHIVAKEKS